jgi:two-component system, OmpR family, response regulator MtrA
MSSRVLVVEDEPALARGLADHFRDEGFEVRVVGRGDLAVPAVRDFHPDLVVLDILLPARSGLDVLRELRAAGDRVPILMLTAKGEVVDRVVGLELGADDYLPKPFALRELLARVRALMRRTEAGPAREPDEITVGRLRFDLRGMTATGPEGPLDLTPHDILVLKVLALRRGEVVPRADIVEEVCGLESEATLRKVDNHVMALRRALADDPRRPRWIHTVRGHGYRLARADRD